MAFLIVAFRALLFLVALPLVAYAIANIFLPDRGFVVPVAGTFDLRELLAAIVFVIGFLTWAQYPAGRRNPPDDDPDAGVDFDNET